MLNRLEPGALFQHVFTSKEKDPWWGQTVAVVPLFHLSHVSAAVDGTTPKRAVWSSGLQFSGFSGLGELSGSSAAAAAGSGPCWGQTRPGRLRQSHRVVPRRGCRPRPLHTTPVGFGQPDPKNQCSERPAHESSREPTGKCQNQTSAAFRRSSPRLEPA